MVGRIARIGLVVVGLMVVGCGKKAVPDVDLSTAEARQVLLAEQHDPAEVRAAIISAMGARGWVAEQENGPEIVAHLNHKGASVRVSMTYAADRVTIKGLEAEGAGRNYDKWVANLESSIRDGLKKPVVVVAAPAVPPAPTLAVFEAKQKLGNVKGALQRALGQHSWVIEQEEAGGALIARLNHRKGLVRVRISFDETQATITYVTSEDLDIDPTGRSAEYEKWMRNLVEAIRNNTRV
jgi:hypothetical protein